MLSKFFNNIVMPIFMMVALVTILWLFFTFIVFFAIIFVVFFAIAFLAFIFGMIPIAVTHVDGTKKQYYIGDVIRLWKSK